MSTHKTGCDHFLAEFTFDFDPPAAVLVEGAGAAAVFVFDVLPATLELLGVLALVLLACEATTDEPALLAIVDPALLPAPETDDPTLLPPLPEIEDPVLLPAKDDGAPSIIEDPPA